jgi:hypothetical protein
MQKKKIKKSEMKAVMSALAKKGWAKMSKEEKTARAKKMAAGRWGEKKNVQTATP